MKNAILASTSTLHAQEYLEYLLPEIKELFKGNGEILFIPYARPGGISHIDYTDMVKKALEKTEIQVKGIHEFNDPVQAVQESKGIFTGG